MFKACDTSTNGMENLSVLINGYSQEIAETVKKISNKYNVSMEFALLIVQTGIEEMKMDIVHNKNYHIQEIANSIFHLSGSFEIMANIISDSLNDSASRISEAIESVTEQS